MQEDYLSAHEQLLCYDFLNQRDCVPPASLLARFAHSDTNPVVLHRALRLCARPQPDTGSGNHNSRTVVCFALLQLLRSHSKGKENAVALQLAVRALTAQMDGDAAAAASFLSTTLLADFATQFSGTLSELQLLWALYSEPGLGHCTQLPGALLERALEAAWQPMPSLCAAALALARAMAIPRGPDTPLAIHALRGLRAHSNTRVCALACAIRWDAIIAAAVQHCQIAVDDDSSIEIDPEVRDEIEQELKELLNMLHLRTTADGVRTICVAGALCALCCRSLDHFHVSLLLSLMCVSDQSLPVAAASAFNTFFLHRLSADLAGSAVLQALFSEEALFPVSELFGSEDEDTASTQQRGGRVVARLWRCVCSHQDAREALAEAVANNYASDNVDGDTAAAALDRITIKYA